MNTLTLPIPLTIPQLADLLRQQLTPEQRRELTALVLEEPPAKPITKPAKPASKAKKSKEQLPSVADDLREAFEEVRQARKGQKQFRSLTEVLNELQG
ncbi:hypothetical protein [Hymenobacter aerophilus]|uniref:hypothetical protein n=1 Tax=Hymenobacter aerophilus TaxID=119644 RepID=UPI00037C5283|nr:hypothetical protein [Hymenobacter aerophilus]